MRKSHYALLFILQLTTVAVGVAQPSAKLRDAAFDLYNRGKYRESLELLTRLEEQKTGDLAVETAIGIAAYNANRLPQAKQYLQLVVANFKVFDPSVFLYLGRVFHSELKFRDAIKFYKRFLNATDDKNPERRRTVGDIRRCAAGLKIIQLPELALVENLGEAVNSRFDEFAPVQSLTNEDRIYFSAAREDADGGLRNDACLPDVKNGHYFNDIYFTELDGGDWRIPNRIDNALINTPRHEQLLDITNGGKTLIFFRSMNALSGDILVDTFKSETEIRSLPPKFISPLHAENGDNTLFFFNDSLLIFSARRPEGFGGLDLYFSVWRYGAWQEPKNLGSAVNSGFDETAPFLAKDGRTLYFSSNSPNSMGGFDIFKSKYDDDSLRFMPPVNLGKPINSAGDDMFFRLTTDGMRAYFCSSRKDGYGERDIYTALFKQQQRDQNPSSPVAFHLVEQFKAAQIAASGGSSNAPKLVEATLAPIFYDNDDDILRGANLQPLRKLIALGKQFPTLKILLTANCSQGEKTAFDLYFTMKRVEKVAKYLIDNGLQSEQIVLKSVGSEYPIAQTVLNGVANAAGEKLNRRIDLAVRDLATPPLPLKVTYNEPTVSQFMVNETGDRLKKHAVGLSYKIQIVTTKRIYDNEILSKYGDAMMETVGTDGTYAYSVGLFFDYNSAEKTRRDLVKDNMRDAAVVPYVDGQRVAGDEARRFTTLYADLVNYLAARKRP